MDYTDLDMSLRLVEIWYDMTWAFFMSTNTDVENVENAKRFCTSADGASVKNKSMSEKLALLTTDLRRVRRLIQHSQFQEICDVSLTRNDDLYPGFKDMLDISKEMLSDRLPQTELDLLTVTPVFQCIYYRFCDFLMETATGRSMMKMIVMPTQTSQAVYDICRQKFCRVMCDETGIIREGLDDLVATMVVKVSPPPPPSSPQSLRSKTPLTFVDSPPPPVLADSSEPPPSPTFSMVSKTLHKRAPFAAAFPKNAPNAQKDGGGGVRFPLIEMSDSDDSSTTSSLSDEF